jgi:uncharacterized protein YegP (UPF0339 family)
MNERHRNWRGARHLRVGVELRGRSLRVASFWAVDQPAVQHGRLANPILVRVDVPGEAPFVQALDDPRIARGTAAEGLGHSYTKEVTGIVYLSVPFTDALQLASTRVRLLDASRAEIGAAGVEDAIRWADDPPRSVRRLGEFTGETFAAHKDWAAAAEHLGLPPDPGRAEIFLDRAGRHRWRIRRPGGEIVATSHQGFSSRAACEADLLWVRAHLAAAPIVALDV